MSRFQINLEETLDSVVFEGGGIDVTALSCNPTYVYTVTYKVN